MAGEPDEQRGRGEELNLPLACSRCGGRLRLIALIEEAAVIGRMLPHLGLATAFAVVRPARAPPLFTAAGEAQADEYESAP